MSSGLSRTELLAVLKFPLSRKSMIIGIKCFKERIWMIWHQMRMRMNFSQLFKEDLREGYSSTSFTIDKIALLRKLTTKSMKFVLTSQTL